MNAPWLSLIGLGEDGAEALAPAARALVARASLIVGGARHLGMIDAPGARLQWPSPLTDALPDGKHICRFTKMLQRARLQSPSVKCSPIIANNPASAQTTERHPLPRSPIFEIFMRRGRRLRWVFENRPTPSLWRNMKISSDRFRRIQRRLPLGTNNGQRENRAPCGSLQKKSTACNRHRHLHRIWASSTESS